MPGVLTAVYTGDGKIQFTLTGWLPAESIGIWKIDDGASVAVVIHPALIGNQIWESPSDLVTEGQSYIFYGFGSTSGQSGFDVVNVPVTTDPCAAGGLSEGELRDLLTQDHSIMIDGHQFQGPSIAEALAIDKALSAKHARCQSGGNGWGSLGIARAIPPDSSGVQDE